MNAHASFPVPAEPANFTPADRSRWNTVFARILGIEGGWSDNPADRGGSTKYGVSLRLAKALGHIDANRDGFADLDLNFDTVIDGRDIALLTPGEAEAIYFDHFWIRPGIWALPMPFDAAVFDQAVNGGVTAAIKLLQRAINRTGQALDVDGALGPKTGEALAVAAKSGQLLKLYRDEAARRYRAIAAADPTQQRFLDGWLVRAQELGRV